MNTSTPARLSGRDVALLRAIAAGRCTLSGKATLLTIDGLYYSDQFAGIRLRSAGLITSAGQAGALAHLTPAGRALLEAA